MHRTRLLIASASIVAALAPAARAQQAPNREGARQAYDRGTQAYKRGDFAAAAAAYRDADDAAPSPVALQAALDAAVKADDPVIGGELLERARGRKVEGALAASVKKAEAKLAHRAGRVHLTCAKPCTAMLEGAPLIDGGTRWASLGDHTVSVVVDGQQTTLQATVAADQTADVVVPANLVIPPPPPASPPPTTYVVEPPVPTTAAAQPAQPAFGAQPAALAPQPGVEPAASRGIGRGWFWAGVGVTVAGAAGTAALFALASSDHGSFTSQSCAAVGSAACQSLARDGLTAQIAGNVFLGVGVVGAVWTVVSGIWLVRWKDSGVSASVGPAGGALSWTRSF